MENGGHCVCFVSMGEGGRDAGRYVSVCMFLSFHEVVVPMSVANWNVRNKSFTA